MKEGSRARSLSRELALIALGVALISVCAWISVPIALIPVTLQTLAVCLVGGLFGFRGVAAVAVYLAMGFAGIPVFAGFKAGVPALLGPTGGYLFGFLFAALLPALIARIPVRRAVLRFAVRYASMLFGLAVCYLFGTVWFCLMYRCAFAYALSLCVVPYLIPDLVKLFAAAFLCVRLEKYLKSQKTA